MFGDLDRYGSEQYLREHDHGDLYFGGAHHGVEVVAYLDVDAYDRMVYSTTVGTDPSVEDFIAYVREHAGVWAGELAPTDHMLVMSTCATGTNGRHVVIARITDQTFQNPYQEQEVITDQTFQNPYQEQEVSRTLTGGADRGFPTWAKVGIALLVLVAIAWVVGAPVKRRDRGRGRGRG